MGHRSGPMQATLAGDSKNRWATVRDQVTPWLPVR